MKLALIISIAFQLVAAIIAVSLARQTKYNISWIMISIAFLLMAFKWITDLIPEYYEEFRANMDTIDNVLSVAISVLLLVGVIFIRTLFRFLKRIDTIKTEAENRVLQAIMQTEEKERKQLAKDLHDGIGPLLSNIKMSVSALDKTQIQGFNKNVIENISKLIQESIVALKNTSNNLSPHVLDSFGLASAIKTFIENINALGTIDITFNSNIENIRFDGEVEINLYRVICELFQNTIKHSGAANVSLLLLYQDNRIIAQYFDDGTGFDPQDASNLNGMGISNIKSRLKSINGEIEFKRIMPRGMMTSITIKTKARQPVHGKT